MSAKGVERNNSVRMQTLQALNMIDAALADPNLTESQRSELLLQREQIVGLRDNYFEGRNKKSEANAVSRGLDSTEDLIEDMGLGESCVNVGENKTSAIDGAPGDTTTESAGGASADDLLDLVEDPAALVSHFQDNPTEFMEGWREMEAADRSFVMHVLQDEMQMNNQITQMITNMMKAAHDTSMSVARNLKV